MLGLCGGNARLYSRSHRNNECGRKKPWIGCRTERNTTYLRAVGECAGMEALSEFAG